MANFDRYTNYRNDAGISGVVFGANATVLEVELNEIQEITKNNLQNLIKNIVGDGITDISKLTYEDGVVKVGDNCCIIANGILVNCSGLSIAANNGDIVYLQIWEETIDYSAQLLKYGNQQSTEDIPNWAKDPRSDVETSRRKVIRYTLSTLLDDSKYNLALATISNDILIKLVNNINMPGSVKQIDSDVLQDCDTNFNEDGSVTEVTPNYTATTVFNEDDSITTTYRFNDGTVKVKTTTFSEDGNNIKDVVRDGE